MTIFGSFMKPILRFTPAIIVLLFSMNNTAFSGEMIEGRVIGVHDGDTVTLLIAGNQQLKIRLAQIDAPELDQPFGQQSKQSLSDMVFNKTIKVDKETTDKYGRTVGTLIIEGVDANKEQVKRGMAWVYKQYLHDQSLIPLEETARQTKVGLWADATPMAPWDYRHGGKQKGVKQSPSALLVPATHEDTNASCGSKQYCKEMTSCEEAKLYLTQCGISRLDGDGDGIPCEKLCRPK